MRPCHALEDMKRRNVAIGIAVVALAIFLVFFILVPVVEVDTHPTTPDEVAFLRIPTHESLSCAVFGVGTANWPIPSNPATWEGPYTYHYQMGCPPLATNEYSVTVSTS